MAKKGTEIVGLTLRLREGLRARLDQEAEINARSLNSEIVARLEESFSREADRAREKTYTEQESEVLRWMVADTDGSSSDLIRHVVFLLQLNKDWASSPQKTASLLEKISKYSAFQLAKEWLPKGAQQ